MKNPRISRIIIDGKVADSDLAHRYVRTNPQARVEHVDLSPAEREALFQTTDAQGQRTILLTHSPGHILKQCPGTDRQYRCCNYHVINQTTNCPLDCTYCILQFYLNNPVTTVYADSEKLFEEIVAKVKTQPERFFRIGTGELSDSLAFDESSGFSRDIVAQFRDMSNVLLELKTKTATVDNLLDLDHGGHTVIAWSVNPQVLIDAEEHKAASLAERLEAMAKVQAAGYKLALHFDPLLYHPQWEELYEDLIRQLFQVVDPDRVTWISLGTLRFPPEMKEMVLNKFPHSRIMFAELIQGLDGKMRYPKPLRLDMYRKVYAWLHEYGSKDLFIYFCMESAEVWERVMGWSPDSNEHLDYLFAESLYRRFPGLMAEQPQREVYEAGVPLHQEREETPGL